jgi:hypothetical protein
MRGLAPGVGGEGVPRVTPWDRRAPARLLPSAPGAELELGGPRGCPWLALILTLVMACNPAEEKKAPNGQAEAAIRFTDVTAEAGISFVHQNAASDRRLLPETMGSGVACFDADGDGLVDLFFVGGSPGQGGALYLNLGGGKFRDASAGSGLEQGFVGMGAAVGDVDRDGDLDLFVSGVGLSGQERGDRLYLNQGGGRFADASQAWGLDPEGFGTSAAFFDLENDGDLDLYVGRYVAWSPENDIECRPNGVDRSYCTPESYPSVASKLYRNEGGKKLADVSAESGIGALLGKSLGVATFDADGDGFTDLAVANDTTRNFLFRNLGNGKFAEIGLESGIALSLSGAPRGAMGIDAGDVDGDLADDLLIGNFAQEMSALYLQARPGLFADEATRLGLGVPTLMLLTFGNLIADFDNDGRQDLAIANGHIEPQIANWQPHQRYAQPLQVFRNAGKDFQPVAAEGALAAAYVGRGLASLDYDQDGDLDLVLSQNGAAARLLRNDSPPGRYLQLVAHSRNGANPPYGLRAIAGPEGASFAALGLYSGRSYLSASEPLLHLGLGQRKVERLELRWPRGRQVLAGPLEGRQKIQEP